MTTKISPRQDKVASSSQPTDGQFNWLAFFACVSFCFIVVSGVKRFEIWDSVRQFIDYDPWIYLETPLAELTQNAWWIRTALVIPCLLVSESLSMDREFIFSIYVTVLLMLTICIVNRVINEILGPNQIRDLITTLFLLFIAYFMNGRICFAVLGASLLYLCHYRWFEGRRGTIHLSIMNLVALILMTVSTGAFYVGVSMVLAVTILGVRDPRPGSRQFQATLNSSIAFIPCLLLVIHQAVLFNEKLSRWHDGDYLMVVYHGPLMLIETHIPSIPAELLLCGLIACALSGGVIWLGFANAFPIQDTYLVTTVILGFLCGAFGYSTLLTNLPGYILFGWTVLQRRGMVAEIPAHHKSSQSIIGGANLS